MTKKSSVFLSLLFGTSLLFSNTSLVTASEEKLSKAEIKKLKEVFKFSDEHIADLIEDGKVQEYLSIKKPIVSKKEDYYEIIKNGNEKRVEKVTKKEFKEKLEKEIKKNKKKIDDENNDPISTFDYDIEDDHDYITLETWFIYDEVEGDAQASARFEFADDSSTYGFLGDLYEDVLAIGISDNASLVSGTEEFYLKFRKYGFNGEYDSYGHPIYEWTSMTRDDSRADTRDSGGYAFDVNFPSMNSERYQYIKNIRGYMKVEVTHRDSSWGGEMYDVWSHYLHSWEDVHLSYGLSIPPGGSISWEYEDVSEKITGHTQERIYD
ncbi:hypothetical protein T458_28045 [Brevibacillus panacihumi W25]|uniref:Uncharacterized protein n=1 Tax=Brevibacillus panacihumi W25 TaxID=1408254 RepID=V6M1B3_9BACL|nr:hypothetical protein [Brevibacillus panacihumi]EST52127.1 hypothetical protein T458_28045 [Brevibacillus panacihumi W25]